MQKGVSAFITRKVMADGSVVKGRLWKGGVSGT